MTQPRCAHLGGRCTRTGDHWDHDGPAWRAVLPGADEPVAIEARLEDWDDARHVALYLGHECAELASPLAAVRTAAVLARLAVRLLRLAVQLRTTR